jgi:CheY-like chemotaxis protein
MLGKVPDAKPVKKILVVEDNAVNLKLVCRAAREAGYTTVLVENGQQAVDAVDAALAKNEMFDAILMDFIMPVMDGVVASEKIRSMLGRRNIPIFSISSTPGYCPEEKRSLITEFIGKNPSAIKARLILMGAEAVRAEKLAAETVRPTVTVRPGIGLVNASSPVPLPISSSATGSMSAEELASVLRSTANQAAKLELVAVHAAVVATTTEPAKDVQKGLQVIAQQAERLATVAEATTPATKATSTPVSFPATPAGSAAGNDPTNSQTPQQLARALGSRSPIFRSAPSPIRRLPTPSGITPPMPHQQQHQRAYSCDTGAKRDPMLFPATSFSIPVLAH